MALDLSQVKRAFIITDTHLGVRNNSNKWIDIHREFFFEWFIPLCRKNYRKGDCFVHSLVVGDVWVKKVEDDGFEYFECIEGKWENELSDGWWEYEFVKEYFEIID